MNVCGIRLRSFRTELPQAPLLIIIGAMCVFALIGCGTGSNTYSPVVRSNQAGFSIAVAPGSVSVVAGNTANFTVTITETGGFNSPITLSASGLPTGSTATFGELAPTASGATATLSIATIVQLAAADVGKLAKPASLPAATREIGTLNTTFTVTAVGGGITETSTAVISVTGAPDFSVTLTPASVGSNIVSPYGTAQFIATLTAFGGFSSPVTLSLAGQPANTTTSFGSTTVTPTAAGVTTTVNIITSQNEGTETNQGTYPLTLTGTAGTLVNTATASFGVGSFTVTVTDATSGSGNVVQGGTAHYIVTVTSVNGFSPSVTLTQPALPTGCTATFGSGTLTPTAAGATTTLTITTTASGNQQTPPGSLNFSVGGQGGGWDTDGSGTLNVTGSET